MKKYGVLIAILGFVLNVLCAQDRFPVRQLTFGWAQKGFPTWSPDGKFLIYQHSDRYDTLGLNGLWRILPDGSGAVQIINELAEHPRWSPDGKLLVFDADTGNNIKLVSAEGGPSRYFLPDTIHIQNGGLPCWSPDGSQIAFLEAGSVSLCTYRMHEGKVARIFGEEGKLPMPGAWMPDGKNVLIALMDRETRQSTLWKINADGKKKEQIKGHHANLYRYAVPSPDGKWLVYGVHENKTSGLYIMPAGGGKSLPLIVSDTAHNGGPSWSPDGSKLAFISTRYEGFNIWIMDLDLEMLYNEFLKESL
jgi:Tol biopolymer transport system component